MKYRNRKRNKNIIITLILISLLIIGYSLISTNFNIGGVFTLEPVVSNVHYDENISYDSDNTVDGEVVLDGNKTTASTTVRFKKPDDKYSFVIPIVNEGTVDSMLDTITVSGLTTTQQQYIKVSYEYEDGIEPTQYDLLKAGETEYLKVNIVYNIDEVNDKDDLPEEGDHIELRINVQYLQADSNANPVRTYIYSVNDTRFRLNEATPSGAITYTDYNQAISSFGENFFLRHTLNHNLVKELSLGFYYNNNAYFLKGGLDEIAVGASKIQAMYENNKSILLDAFGSNNCTDNTTYYLCNVTGIEIRLYTTGSIECRGASKSGGYNYCNVSSYGWSRCLNMAE